ncbi:acid-sensing ion channel 2-like [Actinia tenebrosa]|uniref:Acid-sensing ion channel 2-like n=1 Tax=Actinia tenebrosa TaxID=6105 RepID=A0A6P8IRB8_ACTTE|nr:acid-sensing ion channel 2-like [Actinia tenebrosa]
MAVSMKPSWSEFASNSTLHGLRYVVGVSSWCRRSSWLFCILTVTGIYLYFLAESVQQYVSKPINTHTSHEFPEDGMNFPLVTICNRNAVMKSKADIGYDDERFKKLKLDLPACDTIRHVSGNLTCGQALLCAYHKYGSNVVENCDNNMVDKLRNALNTSSRIFNPEEFLRVYGHDIETMVVSYCRFSTDYVCSDKDFQPVMSPKGLCYEFKPKTKDGRPLKVQYTGGDGALNVVLDTQTNEGTFGDWSIGFLAIVTWYGEVANRNRGFNVFPGSHAIVGVIPKMVKRLPAPYKTNCSERHLPGYTLYTKDACVAQCFNNATIAACGCRLEGEPGFPDIPVCSIQDAQCRTKAQENTNLAACWCSMPCMERYFETTISYSKFPNKVGISIIQKRFKLNRSEEYIRNNLVYLQIGFVELAYQVDEQIPAYGPSSLFGDIGGNMGLFLGCSLLTVVEFLDHICILLLNKVRGDKKTNDIHNNQSTSTLST